MDAKGHYVKPARRCVTPSVLFSVCVEPHAEPCSGREDTENRTWGRCHAWKSRRHGNRWATPTEFTTYDPLELWAWMHSNARRNSRNYVVSPVASDTLTLAQWWEEIVSTGTAWEPVGSKRTGAPEDGTTRFRRLVLRGTPDIIDYTRYGYRWIWLSGRQYLPLEEEQISSHLGIPWIDTKEPDPDHGRLLRTARERSHLWMRAFLQLTDWWQANSTSSWGFTAGQLAMGVMRSHLEPKALCTHNCPRTHQLERRAAFGGRCSTWYVGDVGPVQESGTVATPAPARSKYGRIDGPLFLLDIRSMYPTILRDQTFPVRRFSYRENVPTRELLEHCRTYGVIASVTMETGVAEYPVRSGTRITYPTGKFQTTLTGPELVQAGKDGKLLKCHEMALYDTAPVFKKAAGALIDMRERARADGNWAWEFFAKLLGNSMGGKLAQTRGRWLERRKMGPAVEWGEWFEGRGKGGKPRRFRAVAGLVWEWVTDEQGAGPHTAAFDYLTAYGRLWMRRLRAMCPIESVISQDTDGIWVLSPAVDALRKNGVTFGDSAGDIRIASASEYGRFFGPRHYYTQSGWTLSGFNSPVMDVDGMGLSHTHETNPIRSGTPDVPNALYTVHKRAHLKLEVPFGVVNQFGWIGPKLIG